MATLALSNIGFIGGGNMAEALVRGLLHSGASVPERVRASDPHGERRQVLAGAYGIATHADNVELFTWADVVVLAVKPQAMDAALASLAAVSPGSPAAVSPGSLAAVSLASLAAVSPGSAAAAAVRLAHAPRAKLVVTIAAGVRMATIEARLPSAHVVRAMPNTPALVGAGATAIAGGARADAADLALARGLFEAVGTCVAVEESALDAVTGLSGSGPAYVMLMVEALAEGGVAMGLARDVAQQLAAQTVYGAAKLLAESGEAPAELRARVTSPGGTTVAGLLALEARGARAAFAAAVEAATLRARELGHDS